jgi:fumarate reductase flavoprotein subunit
VGTINMATINWERETDLIVIGAGTAGLPAAIAAADKGAEVLVLEAWKSGSASSLPYIASGTPFSGTDMQKAKNIEDSPDILCEEAVRVSGGKEYLWRTIADNQLEFYEWIKSIGAKPDNLFFGPGHPLKRIHHFEGGGAGLLKLLRNTALNKGIEILQDHRVSEIVRDCDTGRVVGVSVKRDDGAHYFKARKAVILTTGGFTSNPELIEEYGPDFVDCIPTAPPSHLGDGLKMAMAIGAATEGIGLAVCPSMSVDVENKRPVIMGGEGAINVTTKGKRYCDEMATDTKCYTAGFKKLITIEPGGDHFVVYDDKIRSECPPSVPKQYKEIVADSVEELEKLCGIPAGGLKETLEEYNSDIEKFGYDKHFGRVNKKLAADINEPVAKIETPPFYAIKCKICLTSMKGGLKVNANGQIIDQFGEIIPGIYAAGEVVGGLQGKPGHYYTGHMTVNAFVYGRVVGKIAADESAAS